jgi:hypothetical protein
MIGSKAKRKKEKNLFSKKKSETEKIFKTSNEFQSYSFEHLRAGNSG